MKNYLKLVIALSLISCVLLSSCTNLGLLGEKGSETAEDSVSQGDSETKAEVKFLDLAGYTLIRGENEDLAVVSAISEAFLTMMNDYKIDVSFGIDSEIDESAKEIVFGKTNRSEDRNHRYSDYSIEYKDGRVYICGGSAEATKKAVEWMCKNCVSDGVLSLEKLPYEYNASYSMEGLKVFGIPLSKFSVEQSEGDADDQLYKWLGSRTGMRRVSESGYVIKVIADPTLNFEEIGIELVDKELRLLASAHLGDLSVVTDYFLDAIKTRSSDDLEFDRRDVIELPEPTKKLIDVREVVATTVMMYAETDKDPLSYSIGDDIVFICSLYADKTLVSCPKFYWTVDGAGNNYMGEADGSYGKLIVKVPATDVGCVRLNVMVKDEDGALIKLTQSAVFSAIVNADQVTTKRDEPADFDAFWASQVNKVMAVDPDVISMEKVSSPSGIQTLDGAVANASAYDFYRVKIKTPEECGYAVGYLTIPKNCTSLGITVVFNGYGVGDLSPYVSPSNIVFNVCAHSYELGQSASYYNNCSSQLANYGFTGNESRDTVYFRTMIMRDLQAVRFIKAYAGTEGVKINGTVSSLGIWNGKLRLYGGSQGAFQGIAVAALDKDVTDAYWYIPWMCDVGGFRSEFRPTYTDALRYYDTVYFSRRIGENVNVTLTAGLSDYICPPSGVVALFNEMQGNVTMYFKQGMTHSYTPSNAPTTVYKK